MSEDEIQGWLYARKILPLLLGMDVGIMVINFCEPSLEILINKRGLAFAYSDSTRTVIVERGRDLSYWSGRTNPINIRTVREYGIIGASKSWSRITIERVPITHSGCVTVRDDDGHEWLELNTDRLLLFQSWTHVKDKRLLLSVRSQLANRRQGHYEYMYSPHHHLLYPDL